MPRSSSFVDPAVEPSPARKTHAPLSSEQGRFLKIERLELLTPALSSKRTSKGGGRRACLLGVVGAVVGSVLPTFAQAGAQQEEPLADAVRTALAAAIANSAPPQPGFATTEPRLAYLRWLGEMLTQLKNRTTDHT